MSACGASTSRSLLLKVPSPSHVTTHLVPLDRIAVRLDRPNTILNNAYYLLHSWPSSFSRKAKNSCCLVMCCRGLDCNIVEATCSPKGGFSRTLDLGGRSHTERRSVAWSLVEATCSLKGGFSRTLDGGEIPRCERWSVAWSFVEATRPPKEGFPGKSGGGGITRHERWSAAWSFVEATRPPKEGFSGKLGGGGIPRHERWSVAWSFVEATCSSKEGFSRTLDGGGIPRRERRSVAWSSSFFFTLARNLFTPGLAGISCSLVEVTCCVLLLGGVGGAAFSYGQHASICETLEKGDRIDLRWLLQSLL